MLKLLIIFGLWSIGGHVEKPAEKPAFVPDIWYVKTADIKANPSKYYYDVDRSGKKFFIARVDWHRLHPDVKPVKKKRPVFRFRLDKYCPT